MATIGGAGDAPEIMDKKKKVEVEESLEGRPLLERVLGNGVIGEKISSFLTLADLKAVSSVSKDWCRMVRSSQAFGEGALLLVCKETVRLDKFLIETEYPWKGLEVDVTLPPTVMDIISDILTSVTRLHLRFMRTDKVEGADLTEFMTGLLTRTPELKSLQLESVFLEQILHDVLSDVGVQETLKKLKTLEICSGSKLNDATHYLDSDNEGEDGPFPRNFYQISCIPMKLESLLLGKICSLNGTVTDHVKFVPNIIASNSETLVELSVHMAEVWKLETMKTLHCPHLKRLSLTAYGADAETVALFLTNQPHLEYLSLDIKGKFCTSLLTAVRGKCAKLKGLSLTAKVFKDPGNNPLNAADPPLARINWDFLSSLNSLKEFSIRRPTSEVEHDEFGLSRHRAEGTGVSFLKALPSTLKTLGLRGVKDFWFDIEEDGIILEPDARIALLSKFQNLSSLSLVRCDENFLDDALIQFILTNFTKLQRLEFTHGSGLTNAAITGVNEDGDVQGVSLKNLKSLVHLKIKGCYRINGSTLATVVAHPFLRSLEYLGCYTISKADVVKIVSHNPSLESIAVHISDLDDIESPPIKDELKRINGRVCKVIDLSDQDDWFDQDSESDADEIPTGWGGSDFSGGPPDYDDFLDEHDDYDDFDDEEDYDDEEEYY